MPNGLLIQRYRPKGVLKLISMLDRSSNAISQKPFFAYNTVKSLAFSAGCVSVRIVCVCLGHTHTTNTNNSTVLAEQQPVGR